MIWNEIEVAHKMGKELRYNGYRYKVVAIHRILTTHGETALAELKLIRTFLSY